MSKVRSWPILAVIAVMLLGAGVGIGAAAWAGGDHSSTRQSESATADDGMDMTGTDAGMVGDHEGDMAGALDERELISMMIPHHESAIAMAQIELGRGTRPEARRIAQGIIAAQRREIAQMQRWYRQWFGEEVTPSGTGPHASVDVSELESTDDPDRVFLRMMIPHHASAITMADQVLMGQPRKEIVTLANEIIAAQAKEIGQMQALRERSYPPLG